jgi:hypothetical protein
METKRNSTGQNSTLGLISLSAWLKQIGRSDTTGWRWVKAGWLHPLNIAGRPYLTAEDIRQFQERATTGEFSQQPHGAAAAAKAKKEKNFA